MSKPSCLILVAALAVSPAAAHVSLETKQATVGASYKAVFTVPHGCVQARRRSRSACRFPKG